jgi:hypothetical protein
MKKMIQKLTLISVLAASAINLAVATVPASAFDCKNDTSIIKVDCDDKGSGIGGILQLVLTILTAGVAIAAIAGISIAAFTYTTAGGNEEKVKKSKDRILQIVIGLLVYGIMWAALQWLIPGGVL